MYKLTPSRLNAFKTYRDGIYGEEVISLQDTIDSVRGVRKSKFAFDYGNAVHDYLQTGQNVHPVIKLLQKEIDYLDKYRPLLNGYSFENWNRYEGHSNCILLMRNDGQLGNFLGEYKTTKKNWGGQFGVSVDYYEKQPQWKCYLLATECTKIDYHVFCYGIREDKIIKAGQVIKPEYIYTKFDIVQPEVRADRDYRVRMPYSLKHHTFSLYPYTGMKEEINSLIDDVLQFAEDHNFIEDLKYKK